MSPGVMINSLACMACGVWCVVCGVWCVVLGMHFIEATCLARDKGNNTVLVGTDGRYLQFLELGEFRPVRLGPVYITVATAGVAHGQQVHVPTLVRRGEDPSPHTPQLHDGIAASIVVRLGYNTLHAETTMDTFLLSHVLQDKGALVVVRGVQ